VYNYKCILCPVHHCEFIIFYFSYVHLKLLKIYASHLLNILHMQKHTHINWDVPVCCYGQAYKYRIRIGDRVLICRDLHDQVMNGELVQLAYRMN